MKWMTQMENIVINLTGCDRQIANTIVNTILEEDAKANSTDIQKVDHREIKTHWRLSENGWEYYGDLYITSKEMPVINGPDKNALNVDGVKIEFDEEIEFAGTVYCQTDERCNPDA